MISPRFPHAVPFQLTGNQGNNPAYVASGQINFFLQSLPLLWAGNHCLKLLGIQLDIIGTAHSGATAVAIKRTMDDIKLAMFANFEVHGCVHQTPIQQQNFTGVTAPMIEIINGGGELSFSEQVPLTAAATVQGFKTSLFLPLCDARGPAPENEALPTLFFKDGELLINFQAAGFVKDAGNNTLTIDTANIRATAWCVPTRELTMGPVLDWQLFQSAAISGSDEVILQNLGSRTGLGGTAPDAALIDLLVLTNAWSQASGAGGADTSVTVGSFDAADLTQLSAAFLGIDQTQDFQAIFEWLPRALGQTKPLETVWTGGSAGTLAGYVAARSRFPWCLLAGTVGSAGDIYTGLKAFALSVGTRDLNNTKARVLAGSQTYRRTITGGASGTDNTLCSLKRAFTDDFLAQARSALLQSGVAGAVIGDENVNWETIGALKGPVVPSKLGFLPRRLAPANQASPQGR
jgi:hypothetical protein